MLVYIGGFLTFMAIGGFPSFVEDMKVSCAELNLVFSFIVYEVLHILLPPFHNIVFVCIFTRFSRRNFDI